MKQMQYGKELSEAHLKRKNKLDEIDRTTRHEDKILCDLKTQDYLKSWDEERMRKVALQNSLKKEYVFEHGIE
jgi:hypothetical protein